MDKCEVCGVPWIDHKGPTALCGEVQRLTAELEESAREDSEALTQVEKFSVENGRLTKEIERLKAEPAEVLATSMENALRVVERDLDRTRAELADAQGEVSNAHSAVYNITPNRTEMDMLPSLDEQVELLRQRHRTELADARKAAESLYTSMLAGFLREEIVKSALEKWPWLGPVEPFTAPKQWQCNDCGGWFDASLPKCPSCGGCGNTEHGSEATK
jgi:rubrerythrin